jgi:hypothetical protein
LTLLGKRLAAVHFMQQKHKFQTQKSPPSQAGFFVRSKNQLLDFGFFVHHVLASYRIEFFDFDFVRSSALVLIGGVEVACVSARHQTDQFTHDYLP